MAIHQFTHDNKRYQLEIPLEGLEPNETGFNVATTASVHSLDDGRVLESVQIDIEANFETRELKLSHEGQVIGILHLNMGADVDRAADQADSDINWLALIQDFNSGSTAEQIIDAIPTDPLLGCFIKGGVSATLGQIIQCWARIRPEMPDAAAYDLGREMIGCLGRNSIRTLGRAAWRIGRCMIRLGL